MEVSKFVQLLDVDFYTGVPDSQLKPLCDYLMEQYGISEKHIIGANEGNCTAIAAGYHLATNKIAMVYMQNSGIGNAINPVASLLNEKVYAIPCIFVLGWRGEPGVHDEPQHIYQGEVTIKLLEDIGIKAYVVDKTTTESDLLSVMQQYRELLAFGKSVAFVIKKGALSYNNKLQYSNDYQISREDIIRCIADVSGDALLISTTGKASRELFEIRDAKGEGHEHDFLTVGSMGHSSSIALGIALKKPNKSIWCIDGDGAALMHLGAMAVIGSKRPANLLHIIINNEAHETVGGMPTVAGSVAFVELAKACGYPEAVSVNLLEDLKRELKLAQDRKTLALIEVKCSIGARTDLGRPTIPAVENKENFMKKLAES